MSQRASATAIGLSAVLMWSALGFLATASGRLPAFQTTAMAFGLSGTLATAWLCATGGLAALRQPAKVWALGVGGLFGFHAFYFTALRLAPPVEANLVNYLWPLLIVLFSGLLPGERLKGRHVVGAGLGLLGAAAIVTGGRGVALDPAHVGGYLAAAASALTWAGYSILSRRLGAVPTASVAGFCLATAVLSLVCHLAFEETAWPTAAGQWAALVGLGLFPVGLAFFVWDHGVKRGDIQILGAASYLSPLLSTLLLIATGWGRFTPAVGFAAAAITLGAVIASWDAIRPKRASSSA